MVRDGAAGEAVRLPELFAVHGRDAPPPDAQLLFALEDPPVAVCRGRPATAARTGAAITPVYARAPGGAPLVPTGRVLVRFAEGIRAADRAAAVARAGFEIEQVLDYAPHVAWVRARDGIAASLRGTQALETLPDVENVEVQWLARRGRRE